jgi:hypothetical protein
MTLVRFGGATVASADSARRCECRIDAETSAGDCRRKATVRPKAGTGEAAHISALNYWR